MFGRLTTERDPAYNAWGVSYKSLWLRDREAHAKDEADLREALAMWLEAAMLPTSSKDRPRLLREAKALTKFLLS